MPPADPTAALVDEWAALRPVSAAFAGVPGGEDRWDDLSPEGTAAAERWFAGWITRFEALPADLARDVALDWLRQEHDALVHRDAEVDLNPLASPLQLLPMVLGQMDPATTGPRVAALPAALDGYRRTLARGLGRADGVAARQVRAGIAQARRLAGPESALLPLAGPVHEARAAYAAFADWLETTMLPAARTTDGVGPERYARAMRTFLGATPDPVETWRWGWTEVERLEAEMLRTSRELGAVDLEGGLARAAADSVAPDAASFLDAMRERQALALRLIDGLFDIPEPLRRLDVREAARTGQIGAWYLQPSEDLQRPGGVWYLLESDGPQPLWREISTAYHEGFPGHHLQCGTQVMLPLSRLQRLVAGWSGFAEGWALYAEELMDTLGGYERPAYRLGMYANQLIRAWRVVIDIGVHLDLPNPADVSFHPGEPWTFELGVEALSTRAGMTPAAAASEMTRYMGFPGQAISYKVGQRALLDARRAWTGSTRAFHDRVLGLGNVGLDRLRVALGG